MKKKFYFCVFFFFQLVSVIVAAGLLESIEEKNRQDIYNLKKEIIPAKFFIKNNGNNFTVQVLFYDFDNNQVGQTKEIRIKGKEIFFESLVVNLNYSTKAIFPYRIYSDEVAPSEGKYIFNDYNVNSYPAIFRGLKTRQLKKLQKIYTKLQKNEFNKKWYFSSVHIKIPNKESKYKIITRQRGGIEIFEDKDE